jgi:hypothetical protein
MAYSIFLRDQGPVLEVGSDEPLLVDACRRRSFSAWVPMGGADGYLETRRARSHLLHASASQTCPAKFLVFLIKDKGAPALVPIA